MIISVTTKLTVQLLFEAYSLKFIIFCTAQDKCSFTEKVFQIRTKTINRKYEPKYQNHFGTY